MKQMLHTKALVDRKSVGATQAGVIDEIIGSTPVIDRMGDTIMQEGWDLKDYKENPVILWGHNMDEEKMPIGKALKVWIEGKGADAKLKFKVQFDLADSFAAQVYRKIKDGFINTVSVGFLPTEWEELEPGNFWGGLKYTKQSLLELSVVPVPANPQALVSLRSLSQKDKRFSPVEESKLFPPTTKEELKEMLNITEEASAEAEQKLQEINADPNAVPDEEGNIDDGTGGGGDADHIENKPDGTPLDYNHATTMGDNNVAQLRDELNMALSYSAAKTASANKAMGSDNELANPTDPYNGLCGMGDYAMMPAGNMQVKEMSVGNMRSLMTDVMGDWMSNMNTTSNQDADTNDYAFHDGESKEDQLRKTKSLIELVEKAGRVISGKNEARIQQAVSLLQEVLAELEANEPADDEPAEDAGKAQEEIETKGAIGYADHGTAPESEAWDAAGEMAKATEPADWKAMCAWYDSSKPDDKGSYKLPHHQGDGEHKAVWRGVAAAMAALLGARGGVDIPEGDRKGVYNHLKKHYAEFDKEAPEFKAVEDQVLAGYDEEVFALILDREEKHIVRLIKKVLENQKEQKKVVVESTKSIEVQALELINSALTQVSSVKGGDKK